VEKLSNKVCDQITSFVEVSQKLQSALGLTKKKSPQKPGYNFAVFSVEKNHKSKTTTPKFFKSIRSSSYKKPRLLTKQPKKRKSASKVKEQEETKTKQEINSQGVDQMLHQSGIKFEIR